MRTRLHSTIIEKATRESAITGKRIGLADQEQRGLMLRITPNGIRTWTLSCRDFHSRYRMFTIGSYPAITLSAARIQARSMREDVRRGADPTNDKRERKRARSTTPIQHHTIRSLLNEYEQHETAKLKSWPRTRVRLTSMLNGIIDKPFSKLTYGDLRHTFESHPSQISAKWGCQQLKPVFRWAVKTQRDYVPANFTEISFGITPTARKRVLSPSEIKAIITAIQQHNEPNPYLTAMHFILLTLLRVNEVASIKWSDVDLKAKTIKIPETKNGEPHILPLSRQALQIIHTQRRQGQEHVFSGIKTNWNPAQRLINKLSNTSGWHRHDLRRTGATLLGELGVMPDIVEAALNHVHLRNSLASTYNKARYRPQVAEALQRLADHLDTLLAS